MQITSMAWGMTLGVERHPALRLLAIRRTDDVLKSDYQHCCCSCRHLAAGMLPYQQINPQAPFAAAFNARGAPWMAIIVGFGSVCGILDTIVVTQYSMSRTFVILGRMGLVPPVLVRGLSLMCWGLAGMFPRHLKACICCNERPSS